MRIVDYIFLAFRDLKRQTLRSSLTLFALVISTVVLVIMVAISVGGSKAIADQFGSDASLSIITVTPNQSGDTLSPFGNVQEVNSSANTLTDSTVRRLLTIPGIQSISPRAHIWELGQFSLMNNSRQFVAQVEGIPFDAKLPLKTGSRFSSNDDSNVVILGYGYMKALGYENDSRALIGKTIRFVTQKGYRGTGAMIPTQSASKQVLDQFNRSTTVIQATVAGVTSNGPDQNSIFVPLGWAHAIRTASYSEGSVVKTVDQIAADGYSTLQVIAKSPDDVKTVASSIRKLGYGEVSTLSQVERLQQFSTMMWSILGAVAIIAIITAVLGVVNTMLMSISEQSYVIGVWRACGASRRSMVVLYLIEATALGFIGGSVGAGLGIGVGMFVNSYVNTLLQVQGLTITDIASTPLWLIFGAILVTSLFCTIAGLYPAYKVARQDPTGALRSGQ